MSFYRVYFLTWLYLCADKRYIIRKHVHRHTLLNSLCLWSFNEAWFSMQNNLSDRKRSGWMTLSTACAVVKCLAFIFLISALKFPPNHHSTTSVTFIENPNMIKKSARQRRQWHGPPVLARLIFKDVPLLTRIKGISLVPYNLSSINSFGGKMLITTQNN